MNPKTITMIKAFAMSWILALAACGGSGGNGDAAPAAPSAEGLWIGSADPSRTITAIVLDNGTYWILYSLPGFGSLIAGVVQGTGTSVDGSFSSSDGVDFHLVSRGINNATVSAGYLVKQTFNGAVTDPTLNPTLTFASTYNAEYEQTPSISAIAGTYAGLASVMGGDEPTTITVSSQGVVLGASLIPNGCQFLGAALPRAKGNLYDLSVVVSGGGACSSGPGTIKGIGYFDASAKRLHVVALNNSRSDGLIFVGIKP